jgi:hypothetical protein
MLYCREPVEAGQGGRCQVPAASNAVGQITPAAFRSAISPDDRWSQPP